MPLSDKEIGNKIRAVVVLKDAKMGGQEFANFIKKSLKDKIAPYKIPQSIEFINELPKSPVGKVLRRELIS